LFFWERVSLCSPGHPQTPRPPALASRGARITGMYHYICLPDPHHFLALLYFWNMVQAYLVLSLPQPWNQSFLQDNMVHFIEKSYSGTKI
jgi:hypothetical protein